MNQKHSSDGGGEGPSLGVQGAMIRLAVSAVDDEWSDTFGMICCQPDEHFTLRMLYGGGLGPHPMGSDQSSDAVRPAGNPLAMDRAR